MPSYFLIIDGYNVIAPVAKPRAGDPARWLHIERTRLLDRLADGLDPAIRPRTLVVFDSKQTPAGAVDQLHHREIEVRFAVDHDEADDLIEELIAKHPHPKTLTIVSSDRRLQIAARRRRAAAHDADAWLDALMDGRPPLAAVPKSASPPRDVNAASEREDALDDDEVQAWMDEFGPI